MTLARAKQIDLDATPYYHVMNRCVRRSFLCGFDTLTQTDYSHRKSWIVDRLKFLANIFAIKICAYAIMSNHYHVVLHVDDKTAAMWSDEEVLQRWHALFPKDAKENQHLPSKIKLWRERLTSVSWFMRCLNERIARVVNDEDDCKGRFWEGRFKSQALLDEAALLSAMVYVDLNPIRAGITQSPEESEFTSIYERIQYMQHQLKQVDSGLYKSKNQQKKERANILDSLKQPKSLVPFSVITSDDSLQSISFKFSDYLELVDCTGRIIRDDKQAGVIPNELSPILIRLQVEPRNWLSFVQNISSQFAYAVGSEIALINFDKKRRRQMKGTILAKRSYRYAEYA